MNLCKKSLHAAVGNANDRVMDVEQVIAAAGGTIALAEAAGVDRTTVLYWRSRGRIPVERALRINEELGIPLHEMRPDVWKPFAAVG
jgi:hypothetical protein